MKEKIICSAVKYKDKIYPGARHNHAIWYMRAQNPNYVTYDDSYIEGFLTTNGRFVDRKQAFKIAEDNKQIKDDNPIKPYELFSEDVW